MRGKKACLIINPRAGQNFAKLPDVLAVLSAAGWKVDILVKEYGGHTLELATGAGKKKYNLVIAYGGDGTLNQVVNGVMNAKGQSSSVGVIPGGTANVWAGEIGVPADPVKAVLKLVNSEARKVDIGHVQIEGLTFPASSDGENASSNTHKVKSTSQARHHFLLMAGLGIDAAIMQQVSKPLKYRIGPLAVGVTAAKALPEQKAFPVEVRAAGDGRSGAVLWKGEALQVVIGNTRKYAEVVEMTPNAYIDDGVLDVCVITAGNPLTTLQQITSLLLRRKPDNLTAEYFHGAHLTISAPASIVMQLDGSAVKLNDYLSKADREALREGGDPEKIMVSYRFDAMPRALRVAIPCSYNDALFEHSEGAGPSHAAREEAAEQSKDTQEQREQQEPETAHKMLPEVERLAEHVVAQGRKVGVVGAAPQPDNKKKTYIIAGGMPKKATGEIRPVAVRIDDRTTIVRESGGTASPSAVVQLQEGAEIIVDGSKSKRGVVKARTVLLPG